MKKKIQTSTSKAASAIKRTSSDINQLFNELSTGLSEEFLCTDDSSATDIREALDIINNLKDEFLAGTKNALRILNNSEIRTMSSIVDPDEDDDISV